MGSQLIRVVHRAWHRYLVQPVIRRWPQRAGKRILCYGDSNTWGCNPVTGLRFPFRQRWPGIVQHQLGREILIIEEGLPGRTTVLDDPEGGGRNGKTPLHSYLHRYQPLALVIILLGTNDLKAHFKRTAGQIAQGVHELGEVVLANSICFEKQLPWLLLVAPPPVVYHKDNVRLFEEAEKKSLLFGQEFRQVAQRLQCEFLDAGQVIQSSGLDGVHWDETAHRDLGAAIAKKLHRWLGEDRKAFPDRERIL